MVGKAPNLSLFFGIFSDLTKKQQKRKKKCDRNQTNCADCLLISGSRWSLVLRSIALKEGKD